MPKKQKSKSNKWIIVSAVLLVLLVVSAGANIVLSVQSFERNTDKTPTASKTYKKSSKSTRKTKIKGQKLSERKIKELLNAKRKKLGYSWAISDVDIEGHNADYTVYFVTYDQVNKDGSKTEDLGVIMEYKNKKWSFKLPGTKGWTDEALKKYNLIKVDD